jgi:hypothetical protein
VKDPDDKAQRARELLAKWSEMEDRAVYIDAGRRNGIHQVATIEGWWVAYSPRNGDGATAEGPWSDWVLLARLILEHDEKIRRGEATEGIPKVAP